MRLRASLYLRLLLLLAIVLVASPRPSVAAPRLDKRAIQELAKAWFAARPWTKFERWDPKVASDLRASAEALGEVPEGSLDAVVGLLWKAARKAAPKLTKHEIQTPYGLAEWEQKGRGGKKSALLVGLHGGGEGAGSSSESSGNWTLSGAMGMYPQGIRLQHDTWNTVHGEAFVLTLVELAKIRYEIDPDRVYVVGFSMGGTGSFHMPGRYPDLFAGAIPAHGVIMAEPRSQTDTPEEIKRLQYGILPNLRNVPVYFYTGLVDKNCRPWTFMMAWKQLQELAETDPGGYRDIRFKAYEGLAHAFPPGEPQRGLKWIAEKKRNTFPEKIVWQYIANPEQHPDTEDKIDRLDQNWFYWLHTVRAEDTMEVVAERKGNEFDLAVTVAFPDDFTIYLNPEMIDVNKDVVVRVGGEEVYRGRPVPTFATILESLDARLDRRMVFDRRVKIPEPE